MAGFDFLFFLFLFLFLFTPTSLQQHNSNTITPNLPLLSFFFFFFNKNKIDSNVAVIYSSLSQMISSIQDQLLVWHSASKTGGGYLNATQIICQKIQLLSSLQSQHPSQMRSNMSRELDLVCVQGNHKIENKDDFESPIPSNENEVFGKSREMKLQNRDEIPFESQENIWGVLGHQEKIPLALLETQFRAFDVLISSVHSKLKILHTVTEKITTSCSEITKFLSSIEVDPSSPLPPPSPLSSPSFPVKVPQSPSLTIPSYALGNDHWLCLRKGNGDVKGREKRLKKKGKGLFPPEDERSIIESERTIMLSSIAEYSKVVSLIFRYVQDHTILKSAAVETLHYFGIEEASQCLRAWNTSEEAWDHLEDCIDGLLECLEEPEEEEEE